MDNIPIYGCNGCKTTGGRMSCYQHGQTIFYFGELSLPVKQMTYDEEIEMVKTLDRINYGKVLVPIR